MRTWGEILINDQRNVLERVPGHTPCTWCMLDSSRKDSSERLKAEGELSLLTTATWMPMGSPPTHRQMSETWMTGRRNWKHSELEQRRKGERTALAPDTSGKAQPEWRWSPTLASSSCAHRSWPSGRRCSSTWATGAGLAPSSRLKPERE